MNNPTLSLMVAILAAVMIFVTFHIPMTFEGSLERRWGRLATCGMFSSILITGVSYELISIGTPAFQAVSLVLLPTVIAICYLPFKTVSVERPRLLGALASLTWALLLLT